MKKMDTTCSIKLESKKYTEEIKYMKYRPEYEQNGKEKTRKLKQSTRNQPKVNHKTFRLTLGGLEAWNVCLALIPDICYQ